MSSRPVLPPEAAATQFRFPSPSWDARLGCPAGTYGNGALQVPTQCTACPEGRHSGSMDWWKKISRIFAPHVFLNILNIDGFRFRFSRQSIEWRIDEEKIGLIRGDTSFWLFSSSSYGMIMI